MVWRSCRSAGTTGRSPRSHGATCDAGPGQGYISKLITKFPGANIGVICELSGVVVVDIDEPGLMTMMLARFGDTPVRTFTPSGGIHLWYRSSGERCRNLRKTEGLAVDIKGIGGQVVVPPSVRFNGAHAGRPYGFLAGSWDDISRLPPIRAEALSDTAAHAPTPLRAVKKGHRNDVLFASLLRRVKGCDDIEALLDIAHAINADFDPPLDDAEVMKCTASAWGYEIEGRNWVGKEARVYILKSELEVLAAHKNGSDGLLLLTKLRIAHWGRNAQFPVSAKAMAAAQSIPGWDPWRYRRATDVIVATRLLKKVHHGGHGSGDPNLFTFINAVAQKGEESYPNITNTPPSPRSPASEEVKEGFAASAMEAVSAERSAAAAAASSPSPKERGLPDGQKFCAFRKNVRVGQNDRSAPARALP